MKKIICILVSAVAALSLVSCDKNGGGNGSGQIVGTWTLDKMTLTLNGESQTVSLAGTGVSAVMDFRADGSGSVDVKYDGTGGGSEVGGGLVPESQDFTYVYDDGILTLTISDPSGVAETDSVPVISLTDSELVLAPAADQDGVAVVLYFVR